MDKSLDMLLAFLMSMLPIIELRGGIIYAAAKGINFYAAFAICFLGNILPIPFILFFVKKVFIFIKDMEKKYSNIIWKKAAQMVNFFETRGKAKSESVRNKQLLGLFLFVAIPLPGTGGWTGSLVSSILELPIKKSFPVIALGVFTAGVIMSILSYLIPGLFFSS